MRRSESDATWHSASARWSSGSASGWPWKLPPETTSGPSSGEDERVVRDREQLALQRAAHVGQRVRHGAQHLRRAAQRVGVLHAAAVGVAGHDRAALEQLAQAGRDARLSRLRPHGVQARVEGRRRALEGLERQRRGDGRGREHALGVAERERARAGHEVRAVDQRQALLGLERDRLEPGLAQRLGAGQPAAADLGLALADQHERRMGERRQVARGADGAAARHDRRHAAREQLAHELHQLDAHARVAAREAGGQQQQHGAHDLASSGSPVPTACERSRLRCSCARSSGGIETVDSSPKPVVTP